MLLCYELLDKLVYWNGHIVKRDMYKGKKRAIRFHVHVCKNCEEEFLSYNKESKFCGNSCTAKFTHNNRTKAEKARFKRKISDTKKKNPKPAWNKRSFDYAIYDTYVKWIG
jgi:hypothetical protein